MRLFVGVSGLAIVIALLGCGGQPARPSVVAYPVKGQILYADKPAAGVKVFFLPITAPMVPDIPNNPYSLTDKDGVFVMTTHVEGDGAPEGSYQVLLRWPPEESEQQAEGDEDKLFGWYDGVHSKLSIRVKAGENELPPFKLEKVKGPPPVSLGVPGRN